MSIYGEYELQQRKEQFDREMEHAGKDMEFSGFEEFMVLLMVSMLMVGITIVGIFTWDHLADRWRPIEKAPQFWAGPRPHWDPNCIGTPEACQEIEKAINQKAAH